MRAKSVLKLVIKNIKKNIKKEIAQSNKKWREKNNDYFKDYFKTPQGQVVIFNYNNKRRKREEQQGNGVTKEQWLEMMKFFGFKCAYSGITLNTDTRSIDHIIPLAKDGAHEIWNCVPMYKNLNKSKKDKDLEEWYLEQDFYNEDRVNKINEWKEYAYNKWSKD